MLACNLFLAGLALACGTRISIQAAVDRKMKEPEPGSTFENISHPAFRKGRNAILSVMNVNTFLLEVRFGGYSAMAGGVAFGAKADMDARAAGLADWFNSLADEDVPDVAVFNELFSKPGSTFMQRICRADYKRVGVGGQEVFPCEGFSKFGYATKVLAGVGSGVFISGGVAIVARKGLELTDFHEEVFSKGIGSDYMSKKGFMSVKVTNHPLSSNPDSPYAGVYVLGTHTQAWPDKDNTKNSGVRTDQFKQMWQYVSRNIPAGNPVVFAGDMNVEANEVQPMKETLHATNSGFNDLGFWLPLRESTPYSTFAGGGRNAYLHYDPGENDAKIAHDQIVYSSEAGYATPQSMQWQYVPMKSEECFTTGIATKKASGIEIDDLSDHYAAYGELCFARGEVTAAAECQGRNLQGHRGYTGIGASTSTKQCCPGRSNFEGKCFDWMPGGIKGDRVAIEDGYCILNSGGVMSYNKYKVTGHEGKAKSFGNIDECYAHLAELDLPFSQLRNLYRK